MAYRVSSRATWSDPKIKRLSTPNEKLLFEYLTHNEHDHVSGLYHLNLGYAVADIGCGLSIVDITGALEGLNRGLLTSYDIPLEIVFVWNMLKHNAPNFIENPNVCRSILSQLELLHESALISKFLDHYSTTVRHLRQVAGVQWKERGFEGASKGLRRVSVPVPVPDTVNNRVKEESEKPLEGNGHIPYSEVLSILNTTTGKAYRNTPKFRDLVQARWNEGNRLDDFQSVITKKTAEWKGTESEKYLRPETIFGPKFDGYRNQPDRPAGKDKISIHDVGDFSDPERY